MRIVFMGTPDFAVPTLDALVEAGHEVRRGLCPAAAAGGARQGRAQAPVHERAEAARASRCERRCPCAIRRSRRGFAALEPTGGGRGLRPDPAQADPRGARRRLPQRPRLAAAALARGGADPARDPRRRPDHRRDHHADGGRARHRADAARARCSTSMARPAGEVTATGGTRRAGAGRHGSTIRRRPSRSPRTAPPTRPRSTRPKRGSTGRKPAERIERQVRAFAPSPGAWFEADGERIKVLRARTVGDRCARKPGVLDDEPDDRLRRGLRSARSGPARRARRRCPPASCCAASRSRWAPSCS